MRPSRRDLLCLFAASAGLAVSRRAYAEPSSAPRPSLALTEVTVADRGFGSRFVLLSPTHLREGQRVPLLVLLHGLGETGSFQTGIHAWVDRYGLQTAYQRLRHPPLQRTTSRKDWTEERLAEVNQSLRDEPFRGFVIACPFTPAVGKLPDRAGALDAYAAWITDHVIPSARKEAPMIDDKSGVAIDGCSLGGYVGLEVFLRKQAVFSAWGGVQPAFGEHRSSGYAERIESALAAHGPKGIHLLTSAGDPFRGAVTALAKGLASRKVPHRLRVLPGPHDQPWLREAGTAEMLLSHDRHARRDEP